jgi:hypothetical protein
MHENPEAATDAAYTYPYQFRHPWAEAQWEHFHHASLDESPMPRILPNRSGGIFTADGFDLQSAIAMASPVLEVGGPSHWGYEVLEKANLPSRPIISNRFVLSFITTWDSRGKPTESVGPIDIDLQTDARALPFPDESLGTVMASGLDNASHELRLKIEDAHGFMNEEKMDELLQETYRFDTMALIGRIATGYAIGTSPEEAENSPRTGLILDAMRTLKQNGLLILAHPTLEDVWLAEAMGFKLQAHTRLTSTTHLPRELVYQKR